MTPASVDVKPTTFLDLPPELRNAIYDNVANLSRSSAANSRKKMIPRGTITLRSEDATASSKSQPRPHENQNLSLLLTTKQIHHETLPIFLSTHRIRITDAAWLRVLTMNTSHLDSITHLVIDKSTTSSLSKALLNASALPSLANLDIRISNFRFSKAKPSLEKGFPVLKELCVREPKLDAMMEHLALEEDEAGASSCIYSVEDFQAWRESWKKAVSWRALDREVEKEVRERMVRMVWVRLF
ncbi:hypothetical protein M409DRAFT_26317 [Zasmidium cellare ATCC 36951]|uniref:F-box domain-containing protein n=1 Tax=Zasmidium cellare ATCC 36951 TaxID=1080233 RepID=A0A6A6C817_ZASCE|nr:uncharacterized protein M409DRAFT_26317 [Zasmidium cellare ATCC 36951]KAF2163274.1 hypothetical protein M409DRAFT_26317 [Zasmidium cellare ATCC 36951]